MTFFAQKFCRQYVQLYICDYSQHQKQQLEYRLSSENIKMLSSLLSQLAESGTYHAYSSRSEGLYLKY